MTRAIPVFLLLLPLARARGAATHEIGPGKTFESIGEAPWEALKPGDRVLIYWRSKPYREKWVICATGTQEAPIVVRGVPGPEGQLPVIDGDKAVTPAKLNFWNESRGVLKIGGANVPRDTTPSYIVVENLEIRRGRPPYTFTDAKGKVQTYAGNAAALYIEKGRSLVVRNCVLHDSANGLFAGGEDLVIERCHIYDNGMKGSAYVHNSYIGALGIVYQFNHYGPLRPGCSGNNLKDRSAGALIRCNWIEGGSRQLDLVDSKKFAKLPSYRKTVVYGNVLVEHDDRSNSHIVHYGGDSRKYDIYRKGTLHFYNNTVVSLRGNFTTLLGLSTDDERAVCRNNIVYVTAPGKKLALVSTKGRVELRNNWLKAGWRASHYAKEVKIDDQGGNRVGENPGFLNLSAADYRLAPESDCLNRGLALPIKDLPIQYVKHRKHKPRLPGEALDLGAFERPAVAAPPSGPAQSAGRDLGHVARGSR